MLAIQMLDICWILHEHTCNLQEVQVWLSSRTILDSGAVMALTWLTPSNLAH